MPETLWSQRTSGTRTYNGGADHVDYTVNVNRTWGGDEPDNYLYFPPLNGGYLDTDSEGIGFTLDQPQTIFPSITSTDVNPFWEGDSHYETTGDYLNDGYCVLVNVHIPGMGGDPVLNGFTASASSSRGCPTACTTCCLCQSAAENALHRSVGRPGHERQRAVGRASVEADRRHQGR